MCEPYNQQLVERTLAIARREGIIAHKGVFVAVAGPNLETRAEYRFLRTIGADVVGMSTVPETIVAVHCGLKVVGLSVITDMCLPDALKPANVEEIIAIANSAEPKLRTLVRGIVTEAGLAELLDMTIGATQQHSTLTSAVSYVETRIKVRPKAAVILGSGLGQLADKIENAVSISYAEIPGFSKSTASGHRGQLVTGFLAGQPVVAMAGRFHRYEGHSNDDVAFPVRVMQKLGATCLSPATLLVA